MGFDDFTVSCPSVENKREAWGDFTTTFDFDGFPKESAALDPVPFSCAVPPTGAVVAAPVPVALAKAVGQPKMSPDIEQTKSKLTMRFQPNLKVPTIQLRGLDAHQPIKKFRLNLDSLSTQAVDPGHTKCQLPAKIAAKSLRTHAEEPKCDMEPKPSTDSLNELSKCVRLPIKQETDESATLHLVASSQALLEGQMRLLNTLADEERRMSELPDKVRDRFSRHPSDSLSAELGDSRPFEA